MTRLLSFFTAVGQDSRHAWRVCRRSPWLTAAILLSLTLGIGATTTIFSLLHVLVRPLSVREPEQLVEFVRRYPNEPRQNVFPAETFDQFRRNVKSLDDLAGTQLARTPSRITAGSEVLSDRMTVEAVSGNYFQLLGLNPALGRLISDASSPEEAVVSWDFWKHRLGDDPSVLGRRIEVNGKPMTISGVVPRGFAGLLVGFPTELWIRGQSAGVVSILGRRKAGVSLQQVQAEMAVLYEPAREQLVRDTKNPVWKSVNLEVASAASGFSRSRERYELPARLALVLSALLLAIACCNIAGLLVARGAARAHEMGVRSAIGATKMRIAQQLATESLWLSGAGGIAGVVRRSGGPVQSLELRPPDVIPSICVCPSTCPC